MECEGVVCDIRPKLETNIVLSSIKTYLIFHIIFLHYDKHIANSVFPIVLFIYR